MHKCKGQVRGVISGLPGGGPLLQGIGFSTKGWGGGEGDEFSSL